MFETSLPDLSMRWVAESLAAADPTSLTDGQIREGLTAFDQLTSFAQAGQLTLMAEMARRHDAAAAAGRIDTPSAMEDPYRFLVDEVAVELGLSKLAASVRFHLALDLHAFPSTLGAMRDGRMDLPRAREIVEQLKRLESAEFVPTLEAAAIEYASWHTRTQVSAWLRKRLIAVEPAVAESRRDEAMAARKVGYFPGNDGMSQILADVSAQDGLAVWRMIDQVAHSSAFGGGSNALDPAHDGPTDLRKADGRTMDQRRADALVDLVLGRLTDPASPPQVEVLVTVSADTLAGNDQQPASLAGYGPITAEHARELAGGEATRWRPVATDPATGAATAVDERSYRPHKALARLVQVRDATCRFPGCRRAAMSKGMDLDHTVPWPAGATTAANLAVLCRPHHLLKTHGDWSVRHLPGGILEWTTPSGRVFTTYPADHRSGAP